MELHDVSYGIDSVARPLLLFYSSENRLLWLRYREYDLAHLKLVFEFSIYTLWSRSRYDISKGLDTAYWRFLGVRTTHGYAVSSLMDMAYWLSESLIFKISSFKLQNARLLLIFTKYREYDLAHLKLVFEFSIYTVWKSVRYGVSNGLDTAYWSFLEHGYAVSSLMDTAYWLSE
ncbi:hypothetical protein Tco_0570549 [Tanacetum coccineum]